MELGNMDINSVEYKKASDFEKLVDVRMKLRNLFDVKGVLKCNVMYKKMSKTVPQNKLEEYYLLCEIEKSLESNKLLSKLVDIYEDTKNKIDFKMFYELSIDEQTLLLQKDLGIDFNFNIYSEIIDSSSYENLSDINKLLLINNKRSFILFLQCYTLTLDKYTDSMPLLNYLYKRLGEVHSKLCKTCKISGLNELIAKTKLNMAINFIKNVSLNFSSDAVKGEKYISYSKAQYEAFSKEDIENLSVKNKIIFVSMVIENIDYIYDMMDMKILSAEQNELKRMGSFLHELRKECRIKLIELSKNLKDNKNVYKKIDIQPENRSAPDVDIFPNEYQNMSIEQKINFINSQLNKIFVSDGKTIPYEEMSWVKYKSELKIIPISMTETYNKLIIELEKLEYQVSNNKLDIENKEKFYDKKGRYGNPFSRFIYKYFGITTRNFYGKDTLKRERKKKNSQFEEIKKNSKIVPFESLKRKKRKKDLKKKIIASILAGVTFLGSFSIVSITKKNKQKKSNNKISTSYFQTEMPKEEKKEEINKNETWSLETYDNISLEDEKDNNYKSESIDLDIEFSSDTKLDSEDYKLGDIVNIINEENIYTNSYDATNETNSLIPIISFEEPRMIVGVVYQLGNEIYTIYQDDSLAKEKIDNLLEIGAIQTAVLVADDNFNSYTSSSYEGYYNISSIKSLTKTR